MKDQVATVVLDGEPRGALAEVERAGRTRRLRARRVRAEELQLVGLEATARHGTLGDTRAVVEDLSLTGAALSIRGSADRSGLVLVGDRWERMQICCGGQVLYEGDAHVRHVGERGDDLTIGVEVHERTIDLSRLYRLGAKQSFSGRLQGVLASKTDEVSDTFKVWVNDLRGSLERLKTFLDREEEDLANLDSLTREQTLEAYLEGVAPRVIDCLNDASRALDALVSSLGDDQHPLYRAYYRKQLNELILHSPLLRRAYHKPLGYAGDYEMMNMLYRGHAEGDSLFGRALNLYAAQEGAARANINRLEYLATKIRAAVEAHGHVRIASVGCGPARELLTLLERSPELGRYLDVALLDQEDRVLTYCERTLSPVAMRTGAKVHFIKQSVRRLVTSKSLKDALGERDFIYSAGLFDYLNARSFSTLLSALYQTLAPGGELAVGNVAADNPSRHFMEYCLDWFLIHRSREDLMSFVPALRPAPAHAEVGAEPSGLNLFLLVRK